MYFIFESGGKQYKASPGQKVRVEKLPVEVGKQFSFDRLVMKAEDDKVDFGAPYLKGEVLEARVILHGRGDKIPVIKFKRRKHYMRRLNHRQEYTEVEILRLAAAKPAKQPPASIATPKPATKDTKAKTAAAKRTKPTKPEQKPSAKASAKSHKAQPSKKTAKAQTSKAKGPTTKEPKTTETK